MSSSACGTICKDSTGKKFVHIPKMEGEQPIIAESLHFFIYTLFQGGKKRMFEFEEEPRVMLYDSALIETQILKQSERDEFLREAEKAESYFAQK